MAKFIIIRGQQNSGKTTTAGLVYSELLRLFDRTHTFNSKVVELNSLEYNKENGDLIDFNAILTVNSKRIGIISAGDVAKWLEKDINGLIAKEIEIIICCTRSRNVKGSSHRMISDNYSKEHQILKELWVSYSINKADKEYSKKNSVLEIVNTIKDYLK